jgi:hypothetical protein
MPEPGVSAKAPPRLELAADIITSLVGKHGINRDPEGSRTRTL